MNAKGKDGQSQEAGQSYQGSNKNKEQSSRERGMGIRGHQVLTTRCYDGRDIKWKKENHHNQGASKD